MPLQKISELHDNKNCTLWARDLLDIIENEMLVVLAKGRERSTSGVLLGKLRDMDNRCQRDEKYCLKKVPDGTRLGRWKPSIGVLAKLNEVARTHLGTKPTFLNVNHQDIKYLHRSLQAPELGRLDVRNSYLYLLVWVEVLNTLTISIGFASLNLKYVLVCTDHQHLHTDLLDLLLAKPT